MPEPTGRLIKNGDQAALVIERRFASPIEDVWASLTEPERTARWIGTWRGDAGTDKTVELQLSQEEGAPWTPVMINICDAPRRLKVTATGSYGGWVLEAELSVEGDGTLLIFTQHLATLAEGIETGPGWEYYLDLMIAGHNDQPAPDFNDYHPAQIPYYQEQADQLA